MIRKPVHTALPGLLVALFVLALAAPNAAADLEAAGPYTVG